MQKNSSYRISLFFSRRGASALVVCFSLLFNCVPAVAQQRSSSLTDAELTSASNVAQNLENTAGSAWGLVRQLLRIIWEQGRAPPNTIEDLGLMKGNRAQGLEALRRLDERSTSDSRVQSIAQRIRTATNSLAGAAFALELALISENGLRYARSSSEAQLIQQALRSNGDAQAFTTTIRQQQQAAQQEATERQRAANQQWQSYSNRNKTLLEEVLNYTTTGSLGGFQFFFWVSGIGSENKCILMLQPSGARIDITRINSTAFRIRITGGRVTVGDGTTNISSNPVFEIDVEMERIQNAWALAFRECPSQTRSRF